MTPQITVSPWGSTAGELNKVSYVEAHFISMSPDGTVITQTYVPTSASDSNPPAYKVVVTNGTSYSVPFFASEAVDLTINEIYFNQLTATGPVKKQIVVNSASGSDYTALVGDSSLPRSTWDDSGNIPWRDWLTVDQEDRDHLRINLNHTLSHLCEGPTSSDFSVTPYYYQLTLQLRNRSEKISVLIEQIPKIHVTQTLSNAKVFVNGTNNTSDYSTTSWFTTYTRKIKPVLANNAVYYVNGQPSSQGGLDNYSTNYENGPWSFDKTKNLGFLLKSDTDFAGFNSTSKYRFNVTVVPYDDNVLITNPLETISKSVSNSTSITGDILTKSGTNGSTSTLPITNYNNNANTTAYIGNANHQHCIVTSTGSNDSQRNSTSYVSTINYKAPNVNIKVQSGAVTEDVDRTNWKSFVAPQFIVASSYGMSGTHLAFGQAFLRCATYQEDGYPAGRWRLPTEEEIRYLQKLSSKGVLPNLLSGSYWASSGRMCQSNGTFVTQTTTYGAARCVYDSWYWGEDPALTGSAANSYTIMY